LVLCIPETVPALRVENQGRIQSAWLAAYPDDLLARLDPNRKAWRIG
jgi:hypothetical protein